MNPSRKIIQSPQAPAPIGAYSQAVRVNNLLFVSGQIAIDPVTNELIKANIHVEAKQVMRNIKAILEEAGTTVEQIIKSTIFLRDLDQFDAVNEVYSGFFQGAFPARETVQVARLPKDVSLEISVIAWVD
jgi:2-iminobutanoate/2-iminopropanoate deaminase